MGTATIPLSETDERSVNYLLNGRHIASNKADVFRYALRKLAEDEAVNELLESRNEIKQDTVLFGDIDDLARDLQI